MYERFVKLLQQNDVTAYKVSKDTGIGQSTFTDWKIGRSTPKKEKLQKIAEYFDVPTSYFTETEDAENIEDDIELFNYYYQYNKEVFASVFSRFIKLKRIDCDFTERNVASNSNIDLDKYIMFETGSLDLTPEELCMIMKYLNIDIRFICGSLSSIQSLLESVDNISESESDKIRFRKIIFDKYDLFDLEKKYSTMQIQS